MIDKIKHQFELKENKMAPRCIKCGIEKEHTVKFVNGPKQSIKVEFNEFGCITDEEAIIKKLLE